MNKSAENLTPGETILFHASGDIHIEEIESVYIPFRLSSLRNIQFTNGKILKTHATDTFEVIEDANRVDYLPEHKYTEDYRPR